MRAYSLAKLAGRNCPEHAVNDLERKVRTALESDLSSEQLFEKAAIARSLGNSIASRRLASQAVFKLEAKPGVRVNTRFSSWVGAVVGHNWSADGKRLVAWAEAGAVVFDTQTGQELFRVPPPKTRGFSEGGLRHRQQAKATGNSYSSLPNATAPTSNTTITGTANF
jgi:hypothetical protein